MLFRSPQNPKTPLRLIMIKEFDSKILSTKVKGQKVAFNAYSSAEAEEILSCNLNCGRLLVRQARPMSCSNCHSSFCLLCIKKWLEHQYTTDKSVKRPCPFSCPADKVKFMFLSLQHQHFLDLAAFSCKNKEFGCNEIFVGLQALDEHLRNCLFFSRICDLCSKVISYQAESLFKQKTNQLEAIVLKEQSFAKAL